MPYGSGTFIYLDNAATTRAAPEVADTVAQVLTSEYGNPSSPHALGARAARLVEAARRQVARLIGASENEIVFTSGGTEANNLAIRGVVYRHSRRDVHVVVQKTEHASVLNTCQALEQEGVEVTYLDVDARGFVTPAQVLAALRPQTVLVSIMAVNNETGVIQPVPAITAALAGVRHRPAFHVDAVQAYGKIALSPGRWGIDLMSISGHKIHGPKGIGALYVRSGMALAALLQGGDQERGLRPGTENTPGIAGFGVAADLAAQAFPDAAVKMRQLLENLYDRLRSGWPDVRRHTPAGDDAAPHILNVSFPPVPGEVLVHHLAQDGVYVSTTSACHAPSAKPSHVLAAMGISGPELAGAIRISLSRFTTPDEVDAAAEIILKNVDRLARRYQNRRTGKK